MARKLTAFAGLSALSHLDLELLGIDEVVGRDTTACRGDLLDRRASEIAVRKRLKALGILAAFSRVAFGPDPVHRDRQGLVCFFSQSSKRHRARGEALDDLLGRFDFRK